MYLLSNPRDVIRELLVLDGHVSKDKFIRAYVEVSQKKLAVHVWRFVQSAIFPAFFSCFFPFFALLSRFTLFVRTGRFLVG